MFKILAAGDSLTLPRPEITYEKTWFYKLKKKMPQHEYISVFKRATTTDILVEWGGGEKNTNESFPRGADLLEFYNPDIVILQLGIVDCAPRLIKKRSIEAYIINKLPGSIRKLYLLFVKKIRKRDTKRVDVPPKKFRSNLIRYINRCKKNNVRKIIYIGIPYPDENMVRKNPGIITNIISYNNIVKDIADSNNNLIVINPLDSRKYNEQIFVDGYHPNILGHNIVSDELFGIINNLKS